MSRRGDPDFADPREKAGGAPVNRRVALVGAGIVMAVAYPLAIALSISSGETFLAVWNATFPIYPAVALLILWNRPRNGIGRLFLMLGLVVPLASVAAGYAHFRLPGAAWAAWLSSMSDPVGFGSLIILLPLLFPTGSFLSAGWRWFGISTMVFLGVMTVLFGLTPGTLDCCPGIRNPIDLPQLAWLEGVLAAGFPLVVLSGLAAFTSLVVRYRRARGEERLQIKWFTFAVAVLLLASVVGALASLGLASLDDNELVPIIMFPAAVAGIAVAVGVAVLKYRLYDIDVVINRTLVYGALTAILTGIYLGLVMLFQRAVPGADDSELAVAASTLAVAALFRPARARIQGFIDRRFYRSKYDAAQTLDDFTRRLRDEIDLDALKHELVAVVDRAMEPAQVSLCLRAAGSPSGAEA